MKARKLHLCLYCGDVATDTEHIIPKSGKHLIHSTNIYRRITRACDECNSIAGNKIFNDIESKRLFIQTRLKQKYKRLLRSPNWTTEELNELSYGLRSTIQQQVNLKQKLLERIHWKQ